MATAVLGVVMVGMLTAGIAWTRLDHGAPVSPFVSAGPSTSATPSASPSSSSGGGVLSGSREVTIVRVQATGSVVTLDDDDKLTEADDDSGRQLFVPTPVAKDTYIVKSYRPADGHPATDVPLCWQVLEPKNFGSLTIKGAACDPKKKSQHFTITTDDAGKTYDISSSLAYLQYADKGLILQEVGDGPLSTTFKLVDKGPARKPPTPIR